MKNFNLFIQKFFQRMFNLKLYDEQLGKCLREPTVEHLSHVKFIYNDCTVDQF